MTAMTTKLSMKLRALAIRKPEREQELNGWANKLDHAASSLGTGFTKGSDYYRRARLLYCQVTGRPYEWGADHDLDLVKTENPDA